MTITLKQGDCLELMKELPDDSVDAVITDPPYNISKENDYEICNANKAVNPARFFDKAIPKVD